MPTLYLTEQGTPLRRSGRRVIVGKDDQNLGQVPMHRLEAVVIYGNIQVTTQAMQLLLSQGISCAFLSTRGKLVGRLVPPESKNVPLRLLQYAVRGDAARTLTMTRQILSAKICSQAWLCRQWAKNQAGRGLHAMASELEYGVTNLDLVTEHASLLGIEGEVAARYFDALRPVLEPYGFTHRERRPPPDPVNALLSLGYTVFGAEVAATVEAAGLDPYLGFLHLPTYGRPSLGLDLLEEFRAPFIDRLTLHLFRNRILQPERDFEISTDKGARLHPKASKTYFQHYDHFLRKGGPREGNEAEGYRTLLQRQVRRLQRAFRDERPYLGHLEADDGDSEFELDRQVGRTSLDYSDTVVI